MIKDYSTYPFAVREYIRYILEGTIVIVILGSLFYQSIVGVLFLSPVVFLYCKAKKQQLVRERRWKLNLEFRDGILSLSAALSAGYSAENAFDEALRDLKLLYHENSMIIQEFNYMLNQIRMNITVEKTLNDFANRTGIEDILSFAEVFATAKRTGGDMVRVIKTTSNVINDKIEVKREILTLITAKKFEANIMNLVPLMILCFLLVSSPGFLNPLYHNLLGIMIMTILLAVYLGAYLLSRKIVDIEI